MRVLQEFVTTMEFLQKNVTNFMLLMITLLSTEVDLKTEFLPEFENNVSTNITVQVRRNLVTFSAVRDLFHFTMNDDGNHFSL